MEASARMAKNAATARQLAAESMVLLKNVGNTLPLLGSPGGAGACGSVWCWTGIYGQGRNGFR